MHYEWAQIGNFWEKWDRSLEDFVRQNVSGNVQRLQRGQVVDDVWNVEEAFKNSLDLGRFAMAIHFKGPCISVNTSYLLKWHSNHNQQYILHESECHSFPHTNDIYHNRVFK